MTAISNAGPFDISPTSQIAADERVVRAFDEIVAGPSNVAGWLQNVYGNKGGLDYIFVVNSSDQLLRLAANGDETFVPPATSQNLEAGIYTKIAIINEGDTAINTGSNDSVKVLTGNGDRSDGAEFSGRQLASDLIPGVGFDGR